MDVCGIYGGCNAFARWADEIVGLTPACVSSSHAPMLFGNCFLAIVLLEGVFPKGGGIRGCISVVA